MQYITKVNGSNKWYYKRRIPQDVQSHYPTNKDNKIVKSLRTDNKKDAVFKASKLTRELEAEWNQLRGKKLVLSGTTLDKGRELLKQYGLPPSKRSRCDEVAFDLFVDSIEDSLSLDVQEELYDAYLSKYKKLMEDYLKEGLNPKDYSLKEALEGVRESVDYNEDWEDGQAEIKANLLSKFMGAIGRSHPEIMAKALMIYLGESSATQVVMNMAYGLSIKIADDEYADF
jgi:hypothetical protein